MKDLRLSPDSEGDYDVTLVNGKFRWAKEGTQVANHGHIRMNIPKGTLSLNGRLSNKENDGLDLYGIIFDTKKSKAEKEMEIKRVILQTPGYQSIISFSFEQTSYSASYAAEVQTIYGNRTISDNIEAL